MKTEREKLAELLTNPEARKLAELLIEMLNEAAESEWRVTPHRDANGQVTQIVAEPIPCQARQTSH